MAEAEAMLIQIIGTDNEKDEAVAADPSTLRAISHVITTAGNTHPTKPTSDNGNIYICICACVLCIS